MTYPHQHSISDVSIGQIESYLQKQQWNCESRLRSIVSIWHHKDNYNSEVLLPISIELKDYSDRMRDAIEAIASHEQRSVIDIVSDIFNLFSNIITVRVIGSDTKDGTIPISDGVLLISNAKDMLISAAMSMFSKRKQFSGKPPKDAAAYIDSLLLGQTEIGSYVVNVLVPQQTASVQNSVEGAEPVEGVALSLAHGLDALNKAKERYAETGDVTAFDTAVRVGASANLCDALMGFSGEEQKRDFEIRISGAAGPWFDGETKVFSFEPDDVEILKIASKYYKDDYVLTGQRIIGFVRKLHRDKGSDVGKVSVEASVNESTRSVQIELDAKEYHDAVTAHDKQLWIECLGEVHIKGRSTKLLNHSGFKILEVGELF